MGVYLNSGKDNYQMAVNSEIFIDKTEMILYLNSLVNTQQRFVSVSRPRRFGKTMAADMACAYYSREADNRGFFSGLKIANANQDTGAGKWDEYLGRFDVIRVVMTDFMTDSNSVQDMLKFFTDDIVGELMDEYPNVRYGDRITLRGVMNAIFAAEKRQFVFIIDEWDAIFRVWKNDAEGQVKYLDFLRDLLKDKSYIALAYITGILPIKKYGQHSALNMFTEYSMISPRQLAPYTGFTEDEVKVLCEKYKMDYSEVKDWYDGYLISDRIPTEKREEYREGKYDGHKMYIYCPLSVVESMDVGLVKNYWNNTETYAALAEYIRRDYDGLKEAVMLLMNGGRFKIDTSTYQNDLTSFTGRDDILSLLIHLGYLGYDDEKNEVFIPNKEILDEFRASTKDQEWINAFKSIERA